MGVCDKHKHGRSHFLSDDDHDDDDGDDDGDEDDKDDDGGGVLDRLAMGVCDKHKQGEATSYLPHPSIRSSHPSIHPSIRFGQ